MGRIIKGWDGACIHWYIYTDCTHCTESVMSLTKEQQKELEILAAEIEAEAIQMKLDYENIPSQMSGSVVVVHEDAEILDEEEWKLKYITIKQEYNIMDEKQANQMINLLASIEQKLSSIAKILEDKEEKDNK